MKPVEVRLFGRVTELSCSPHFLGELEVRNVLVSSDEFLGSLFNEDCADELQITGRIARQELCHRFSLLNFSQLGGVESEGSGERAAQVGGKRLGAGNAGGSKECE